MPKTSSSWGHRIESIAEARKLSDEAVRAIMGSFGEAPMPREYACTNGLRCPGKRVIGQYRDGADRIAGAPAVVAASYRYVTGRSGRTTYRDLFLCQPCAEKFAAKHGLTLPAAADPVPTEE